MQPPQKASWAEVVKVCSRGLRSSPPHAFPGAQLRLGLPPQPRSESPHWYLKAREVKETLHSLGRARRWGMGTTAATPMISAG